MANITGKSYYFNGSCYKTCSELKKVDDGSKNCIDCILPKLFDKISNSCKFCNEIKDGSFKYYYFNGICYKSCFEINKASDNNFNCVDCPSGKYLSGLSKICVNSCEPNLIKDSINGRCNNCKDINKFYYNGSCHSTSDKTPSGCPMYTILDPFNLNTNSCYDCKSKGKFLKITHV